MGSNFPASTSKRRWLDFAGIFLLAMGVLLYEVTLTRIFSFVIWSHFAFMIVSTALFGFGLSGVWLSFAQDRNWRLDRRSVPLLSSLFALFTVVSLAVIILVPLDLSSFDQPIQWLYLFLIYVGLIIPFFTAGLGISILLSGQAKEVHRLYFFDLIGAGLGSILLVFIITPLGASGAVLLSAVTGLAAALCFLNKGETGSKAVLAAAILAVLAIMPWSEAIFDIPPHQAKRMQDAQGGPMLFKGWSMLSRIDVSGKKTKRGVEPDTFYINGGENSSGFGFYLRDGANPPDWRDLFVFPYLFLNPQMRGVRPRVAIIGTSGGIEPIYAIQHGARRVDAIEMDPLICKLQLEDFAPFNDRFYELDSVTLHNDEGRSFIANSDQKYEMIQMVNNHTPIAIASGAINLSETYLLTVDGMLEYIRRLSPNGILAIQRWGAARLLTILRRAADILGIKDVYRNVMLLQNQDAMIVGFFFSMKPYTPEEIEAAYRFSRERGYPVLYDPRMDIKRNLYTRILKDPNPAQYYHFAGFNFTPPTDEWPFFDHMMDMGAKLDLDNPLLPSGMRTWALVTFWEPINSLKGFFRDHAIAKGEAPVFLIALQSLLIAAAFMWLPMRLFGRRLNRNGRAWPLIAFFSLLGMAFIMIELCYIKQYILFLGYPAISISLVIAVLLLFTGLGSFISERFGAQPVRALRLIFPAVCALNFLLMWLTPVVFKAFLGDPFWVRTLMTVLLIAPMGILMGMPFPLGLRLVHRSSPHLVGWAWGVNGFMTVVGSVASVFAALYLGFNWVLSIAGILYLIGALTAGPLAGEGSDA